MLHARLNRSSVRMTSRLVGRVGVPHPRGAADSMDGTTGGRSRPWRVGVSHRQAKAQGPLRRRVPVRARSVGDELAARSNRQALPPRAAGSAQRRSPRNLQLRPAATAGFTKDRPHHELVESAGQLLALDSPHPAAEATFARLEGRPLRERVAVPAFGFTGSGQKNPVSSAAIPTIAGRARSSSPA